MPEIRSDHVDFAISAAAALVMESTTHAANRPEATARSMETAALPAFGIRWNRNVINPVTREWVGKLILKFRNPPTPRRHYEKITAWFKPAF